MDNLAVNLDKTFIRNLKIGAIPKLGAKNQLDCPSGYIKNTDVYRAIGPENARAL